MRKILFVLVLLGGIAFGTYALFGNERSAFLLETEKDITFSIDGASYDISGIDSQTVGDALTLLGDDISDDDKVLPGREERIFSWTTIFIERSKSVSIRSDGSERPQITYGRTVADALAESGISLRDEDIVKPTRETPLERNSSVTVIRVEIKEESVEKKIPFETVEKEDDELSWRKRIVTQKGENGIRTYRYRVSYHDGKEVARKPLGNEVTKEPVREIVTQGTYVKTGKSHTGAASWYAWTGTMAAANPWLPMGSYVKVTNRANGKSVIVRINDRGPFVPGRIIDLDKVAFQEIASIGAGVIDVKMEEITN